MAAGIAAGIFHLLPMSGKSPKEGFMDAFNAVMNFGSGEGEVPIPKGDGGDAETMSAESTAADDGERVKDLGGDSDDSGTGDEQKTSIYPFKLGGFKTLHKDNQDEYIIEGRNDKGYYGTRTDGTGNIRFIQPAYKRYIFRIQGICILRTKKIHSVYKDGVYIYIYVCFL